MWPVITSFEVFGKTITIYSFGTFIVLAFLAGAILVRVLAARRHGIDGERAFNVCFALLFLGLAGARFLYVLVHHPEFARKPMSFLEIWNGGLVFYGGLLTGLLWLAWYLPRHEHLKGWVFTDLAALGLSLAVFVGRWASFLSGENYGKVAPDLPWAVTFPIGAPSSPVPYELRGVPLHPTQLYHGLHGLLLFVVLWFFLRGRPRPGRATGLFLVLYAVGVAVVEVWRADDAARGMVIEGLVSTSQLLSIPVFFAGVAIWLLRRPPETAGPA